VALIGCAGGPPPTFVESDVPLPPSMGVRFSSDIRREGGELTAGRFLLSGPVHDIVAAADETSQRYSDNGWREDERILQSNRASMKFSKDSRTVRVEIDRRRVDPDMSTATVRVQRNG
jgi:hypothetical protein